MNWYHSARAVDELAAQYVLGTLQGRARRRFETVLAQRPEVAARVQDWEARLHRLAHTLPALAPSPALWQRLAQQAGLPVAQASGLETVQPTLLPSVQTSSKLPAAAAEVPAAPQKAVPAAPARAGPAPPAKAAAVARPRPAEPGWLLRLAQGFQALLSPLPAGALAFGLVAGLLIPTVMQRLNPPAEVGDTSVPASYIGVLATPDGRQGLIVASLRLGRTVDLKQVTPVLPAPGQTLFLWTLDAQGQARPVGAIAAGAFVRAPLPDVAEKVFAQAVELGVTLEAVGAAPSAPSSPWVYRGLCGKVWRAPPAAAAPRAS